MINFTDIRNGVSRSVDPHLGASANCAKAINNASRKIYDGNFICNFRAVDRVPTLHWRRRRCRPCPRPSARNARTTDARTWLSRLQGQNLQACRGRRISGAGGFFVKSVKRRTNMFRGRRHLLQHVSRIPRFCHSVSQSNSQPALGVGNGKSGRANMVQVSLQTPTGRSGDNE